MADPLSTGELTGRRRVAELLVGSGPAGTPVAGLRAARCRVDPEGRGRTLEVWLFHDPPPPAVADDPSRWSLTPAPGAAPVSITKTAIVASPATHVELTLAGDPGVAPYQLGFAPPAGVAFDPLRTSIEVRLRPECADLGNCFEVPPPAALPGRSPVHDYLARDWRSLTAALLEFLGAQDPGADMSPADPMVALAELFAHAGDLLHYRLDRVATEAYLETARRRTSVHRHGRLVDYRFHDGLSARTCLHLTTAPPTDLPDIHVGDVAVDEPGSLLAFAIEAALPAKPGRTGLGEIPIYDWGEQSCVLPVGATGCVLVRPVVCDKLTDWLVPGDLLVFEVVEAGDAATHAAWAGRSQNQQWPAGGTSAPAFRAPLSGRAAQVVKISGIAALTDPLAPPALQGSLFQVHWDPGGALANPYPVTIDSSGGIDQVTVARGNVVPAHHGRLVDGPPGSVLAPCPGPVGPGEAPASWWLTAAGTTDGGGAGLSFAGAQAPHTLEVTVTLPSGVVVGVDVLETLLDSTPGGLAAVVEAEPGEPPRLRFRTGSTGSPPPAGSVVTARYEIGSGTAGNLPANALNTLETHSSTARGTPVVYGPVPGVVARNPVPAWGGADPVPLDVVRLEAPQAFAAVSERAVLDADFAAAAARDPRVKAAVARRSWGGSWPLVATLVDLASDPAGGGAAVALGALQSELDALRTIGTEVAVLTGTTVGLVIGLSLTTAPGNDPGAVLGQTLRLLRPGTDDHPGFFHHSHLSLGSALYTSAVANAVAALPAVVAVEVTEARRLSEPPGTLNEVLRFGAAEVAALDDNPERPDRGRLDIVIHAGGAAP